MNFDEKNKVDRVILKYLDKKSYLVVDPSKLIRPTIKKLMAEAKVEGYEVGVTDKLSVSQRVVVNNKPNFVFCYVNVHGDSFTNLLENHINAYPNRSQAGFYVIVDDPALAESSLILDSEIDGVLAPPFSNQSLLKTIKESIQEKVMGGENRKLFFQGQACYFKEKYQDAVDLLEEYLSKSTKDSDGYYYLAMAYSQLEQRDKAVFNFREGLRYNPLHYRCLTHGMEESLKNDDFNSALIFNEKLIETYKVSPVQVPNVIKILVANQKYGEVFEFAQMLKSIPDINPDQKKHIAAGLILCSQHFKKNSEFKKLARTLEIAEEYAGTNFTILKNICQNYVEARQFSLVNNLLKRIGEELDYNKEFEIFEFEVATEYKEPMYIFQEGQKLLKKGLKSPGIYHGVIKASISLQCKPMITEDFVYSAKKDFPNNSEEFESYLK